MKEVSDGRQANFEVEVDLTSMLQHSIEKREPQKTPSSQLFIPDSQLPTQLRSLRSSLHHSIHATRTRTRTRTSVNRTSLSKPPTLLLPIRFLLLSSLLLSHAITLIILYMRKSNFPFNASPNQHFYRAKARDLARTNPRIFSLSLVYSLMLGAL